MRSIGLLALLFAPTLLPARFCRLGAAEIDDVVARIVARPELKASTLGVFAVSVETGEVLLDYNADKLLAPASNVKLVSCAGALHTLGKDFRFETPVVGTTPVVDGILGGDLVLVASGDPNLSQRITPDGRLRFTDKDHSYAGFYDATLVPGDPLRVIKDLARQVKLAGVREIAGDIVVDDGLFTESEDEFVGTLSAVCVNDNLIDVTVTPGKRAGEPARHEVLPQGSLVDLVSTATTAEAGAETSLWLEARPGAASFHLSGRIALDSPAVLRTAPFANPAVAAAGFLHDALKEAGVVVRGKPQRRNQGPTAYSGAPALARHVSPPLSEALRVILKVSQNLHSTMLPALVGAVKGRVGHRVAGYDVIRERFKLAGLDTESIVLQSGSGGGRADHVTPRFLVELLQVCTGREDFPLFLDMLPVGGVDGTLASNFLDEDLRQRVHAKTGTLVYKGSFQHRWIYLSKSLSGYVDISTSPLERPQPRQLVAFSIIIANTITDSRKQGNAALFRAQEDIVRALINAARGKVKQ